MKKKGLIISTAVMVVVLIAALTTGTFAWFSQTGQVTVSEVNLSTKAAEGLQIAFVKNSTWKSGDFVENELMSGENLKFAENAWAEGTEGWGSTITLDSEQTAGFTNMEHAVTRAKADSEGDSGATYKNGDFVVPTGYDASIQPEGYSKAVMNTNYLQLPIVLQATTQTVAQIYYTIIITPEMGTVPETLYPGMAAAARIQLNDASSESIDDLFQPFNDAQYKSGQMIESGTTNNYKAKHSKPGRQTSWIYSGLIAGTDGDNEAAINALEAKQFFLTIWIEGTDTECINLTAGSGFTVEIKFGYVKVGGTALTSSDYGVDKDLSSLGA